MMQINIKLSVKTFKLIPSTQLGIDILYTYDTDACHAWMVLWGFFRPKKGQKLGKTDDET